MPDAFDPYRKWLGIPAEEQPPHHYRLLGVGAFEDDPDVIENAADQRMAHVRTLQTGQYAALSQRILNELASAKVNLLNAEKKKTYDAELRARLGEPVEFAAPAAREPLSSSRSPKSTDDNWPAWKTGVAIGAVGSLLILLSGGAWILAASKTDARVSKNEPIDSSPKKSATSDPKSPPKVVEPSTTPTTPSDAPAKSNDPVPPPSPTFPPSIPPEFTTPRYPTDDPFFPAGPPVPVPGKSPTNPPAKPPNETKPPPAKAPPAPPFAITKAGDQPIELLSVIDTTKHGLRGTWRMDNTKLVSPEGDSLLAVPYQPPDEYLITVVIARQSPQQGFLTFSLPLNGKPLGVTIDEAQYSGFEQLDGKNARLNSTGRWQAPYIIAAEPTRLQIVVRKDRCRLIKGGVSWSEFPTSSAAFVARPGGRPPQNLPIITLGGNNGSFAITKMLATPLPGGRYAFPDDATQKTLDLELRRKYVAELQLRPPSVPAGQPIPPDPRIDFTRTLLTYGLDSAETRDWMWAHLRLAQSVAMDTARADLVWSVFEEQSYWFPVDRDDSAATAFEAMKRKITRPTDARVFAQSLIWLLDEIAANRRVDLVARLLPIANGAVTQASFTPLSAEWTDHRKQLQQLIDDNKTEQDARQKYEATPDDPALNTILGRAFCFAYGDWEGGLPMLAKGNSEPLKKLAVKETPPPKDTKLQLTLAESWQAAVPPNADAQMRAYYLARARYWYRAAVKSLPAGEQADVQHKLSDFYGGSGIRTAFFPAALDDKQKVVVAPKLLKTRTDKQIEFDWATKPPDAGVPLHGFDALFKTILAVPRTGEYLFSVESHEGVRIKLDGEMVFDLWATRPARVEKPLFLVARPYDLEIEYYNIGGPARLRLSWQKLGRWNMTPIAEEFFYGDRASAIKAMPLLRLTN